MNLLWNNVKHLNRIKGWSDDILYPKDQHQCEIIMFSKKCPVHYSVPQLRRNVLWTTKPHMTYHWQRPEQIMILSVWLNCSFNGILGLSPCLCACVYCLTMGVTLCLSHVIHTRCGGGWNLRDFYCWSSNGYQRGQWSANTLIGSFFFFRGLVCAFNQTSVQSAWQQSGGGLNWKSK